MLLGLIFILLLLLALLNSASFQTYLTHKATDWLSAKMGFPTHIEYLNVDFLGNRAFIRGVSVTDLNGKELIWADTIWVKVNFLTFISDEKIEIEEARLKGVRFLMRRNPDTKTYNITEWIRLINQLTASDNPNPPPSTQAFIIKKAILENARFQMDDPLKDSLNATGSHQLFDYYHFTLDSIYATIHQFRVINDTIELQMQNGRTFEPLNRFPVHKLDVFFRYSSREMAFLGLDALLGKSHLRDTLIFRYENIDAFDDFNQKVNLYANLEQALIDFEDLARFAPSLAQYQEKIQIKTRLEGLVTDFSLQNAQIKFGNGTVLRGNGRIRNAEKVEDLVLDWNMKPSTLLAADLKPYLPENVFAEFEKLGQIRFEGAYQGTFEKFEAKGNFQTNLGLFNANLALDLNTESYRGTFATQRLALDEILAIPKLKWASLRGSIVGSGFSKEKANFDLDAHIDSLFYNQYLYKKIHVKGNLEHPSFLGSIDILEPNLEVSAFGRVDLDDSLVQMKIDIDYADLQALQFADTVFRIKTYSDWDLKGFDPDRATGQISLSKTEITYKTRRAALDTIHLKAQNLPQMVLGADSNFYSVVNRKLEIEAQNLLEVGIEGNFKLTEVVKDLQTTLKEYQLAFEKKTKDIAQYYTEKEQNKSNSAQAAYQVVLSGNIYNAQAIFGKLFIPELFIAPSTHVEGVLAFGENEVINLNLSSDSISYRDYHLQALNAELQSGKSAKTNKIDTHFNLQSKTQTWSGFETKDFQIRADWIDSLITFHTELQTQDEQSALALHGDLRLSDSALFLRLDTPRLFLLGKIWESPEQVLVEIRGKEVNFGKKGFFLQNENQKIVLRGKISPNPKEELEIQTQQLDLENFSDLIEDLQIAGQVNGDLRLSGLYDTLHLNSSISMRQIVLNQIPVGDLNLRSSWDDTQNKLDYQAELYQNRRNVLDIKGLYQPKNEENSLDADIKIIGMKIDAIEPFLAGVLTQVKGTAYGAVKIKGKPQTPLLIGEMNIFGGSIKIDYLNTSYTFEDKIIFTENQIAFDRLTLYDEQKETKENKSKTVQSGVAILNGGIFHDNFQNFVVNLQGSLRKVLSLNLPAAPENLFYGSAIATGNFEIFGSFSNLKLTLNARSEQGTRIFLPLDGYSGVSEQSFIRFVQKDSLLLENSPDQATESGGFKMEMNFDITPDAYMEIIFDKKVGDLIRGNAKGNLKMQIDTQGDFKMFGGVEIVKGAYNFTFLNIINKEFIVSEGSRINWSGDPYHAQLDLTAQYRQMASLAPLMTGLDSATLARPEIRRKYPVLVNLRLLGDLMRPDIQFGIDIVDYPPLIMAGGTPVSVESFVAAFKSLIESNQQELNRQVFSLIALRRLSTQNAFTGINQSAGSSVSEFLANQLSYWASQVDENLEIDLDLQNLSDIGATQLRLSYSLLQGRMRITREGAFTNVQNQASVSSVVGDWTIEYILSQDGSLRAKLYHKNSLNAFNTALQNNSTAGVSLLKSFSFDKFKDLFRSKKKIKQTQTIREEEIRLEKK